LAHQTAARRVLRQKFLDAGYTETPSREYAAPCCKRTFAWEALEEALGHTHSSAGLTCGTCQVTCRSRAEYDRHCAGKLHRYRADPASRPNLTCTLCQTTCASKAQFETHLETAKHKTRNKG
jgi:hypothetical protein